ncbi:type IV pilus assembly protein PilM [Hippea maritima DSM 10411]|uniref:Type IV pilus assembly protein PilM n=1 Tax=Hippea maritima (strain ATCC 700847 / DSM 10411 / MH2) TaxID=760142 RepID=F2LWW7_HIPMA|nr:type IV pilus assembly protein PilM [Hippea maritima DSM 10411]
MFGKKGLVGIDVGHYFTKIVYFENKKGVIELISAFKERTPDGIVSAEGVDENIFSEFISTVFSENKIRNKNVAISLNSSTVISKTLSMPLVADEEMEQAIMWEAEQYAPFGMEHVNASYQLLERNEEKKEMTVLIAITKKDIIESYKRALKKAKLNLKIVDVDVFAVANAFFVNEPDKAKKHNLFVDVGHVSTKLVFTKNEIPVFSRYIDFGFSDMLDEASDVLEIKKEEIDLIFEPSYKDKEKKESFLNFINDKMVMLYTQIQNSITFYKANILDMEEDVENIVLVGCLGALTDRLNLEFAEELLKSKIITFNPFNFASKSGFSNESVVLEDSSFYTIASGLSLRGLDL